MKVCIFTETFHPVVGGGETQARLLAEGLQSAGCDVTVLTRRSSAELPADDWVGAVPVRRIGQGGPGQVRKWGLVLAGLPALIRLRHACDLLFVSGFRMLGIPAVLFAQLFGKPVVLKADSAGEMSGEYFTAGLVRHGLSLQHRPVRYLLALRNALFRRADAFVAISAEAAGELHAAGIDPSRIHRIPNAVDTTRFRPASAERKCALRRTLGLPQTALVIVYTGRLVSYKGLPLLLDVWPGLLAAHPHALLLFVGTGGLDIHACEAQLRAAVREQRLDNSVRFTGSVDNVVDFLQAADVFAFPTENDVFPSAVVEAMACGLPLVTTPVGAIKEIIEDGRNGLLVAPRDGNALSRALDRLLGDRELASRLGEGALQTVLQRYSAMHVMRCYAALFRRVAGHG